MYMLENCLAFFTFCFQYTLAVEKNKCYDLRKIECMGTLKEEQLVDKPFRSAIMFQSIIFFSHSLLAMELLIFSFFLSPLVFYNKKTISYTPLILSSQLTMLH